jgi:hypothetical protein
MIIVQCPHCQGEVVIEQLNCKIFRHGIFKKNGEQINPHEKKVECDKFIEKNLIFGCGKPFKVIEKDDKYEAIVCDYI